MTESELDELRAKWFFSGWSSAMQEMQDRIVAGHDLFELSDFVSTQVTEE